MSLMKKCFVASLVVAVRACFDWEVRLVNKLFGELNVDNLNQYIDNNVKRTYGICKNLGDTCDNCEPCQPVDGFPLHVMKDSFWVTDAHVDYLSGTDSLKMTNASWSCDTTVDGGDWFIELDGFFSRFHFPAYAYVVQIFKTIPFNLDNLPVHAVARIDCKSKTSLGLTLAKDGFNFGPDYHINLDVEIPLIPIHIDITNSIIEGITSAVNGTDFEPPAFLKPIVDIVCRNTEAENESIIV